MSNDHAAVLYTSTVSLEVELSPDPEVAAVVVDEPVVSAFFETAGVAAVVDPEPAIVRGPQGNKGDKGDDGTPGEDGHLTLPGGDPPPDGAFARWSAANQTFYGSTAIDGGFF